MFRYSFLIDSLLKAMGHKYIRRVPKGVTKTGATKYMYFYAGQEGHGKGIAHESELVTGASFAFGEHGKTRYHAHITKVDGDKVTVKYDDGDKKGTEETMTKKQFQSMIHGEHSTSIQSAKEKATKQLKDFQAGKEKGVKVKQETLDKLEQRVKNLDALTAKKEETQKDVPKEKASSESALVKKTTEYRKNSLQLAKEPANKVMRFLNDVLATSTESTLRRMYHNVLVNGENGQLLAQTGRTSVLLDNPESLNLDISNKSGLIPLAHTKSIAKSKKNATITLTDNKDTFIEDDSVTAPFNFLNKLKNDTKTSTISLHLSNALKNKLQEAIDTVGSRADTMTIDLMYPQDGKISIYFKDARNSREPEFFDTIPYTTNSQLSDNPQRKSLRISPRTLSLILPYIKTWHMSADFSRTPFVFDGEDKNTTIFHMPD